MTKIGPETTKEFARLLQQLDVASLTLQFSGGGDEGGIQSAWCVDHKGEMLDFKLSDNLPGLNERFIDTLDRWFSNFIESATEVDWVNDQGGYGDLMFSTQRDNAGISLSVTSYIEVIEDSHFSLEQILQGEI